LSERDGDSPCRDGIGTRLAVDAHFLAHGCADQ
jgi:hypothetical protein